ncbi:MAG: hypothetical protein ACKO1N_12365 [Erythrobacter sp.]
MTDFQALIEDRAALLFSGTHDVLKPIADHLKLVEKRERDYTGVGFYTTLHYSEHAQPLRFDQPWSFVGGVTGDCPEMPEGFWIGFHLRDGFLTTIEGLANEGEWRIESEPDLTMNFVEQEYRYLSEPYLRQDTA